MAVFAVLASFLATLVIFLAKFFNLTIVPQNIKNIFMLSSYMRDLEINTENLRAKKENIDGRIVEDERQLRGSISQVEVWKKDVDAIMPELQILVDYHKTRCRHHHGFSFICSNYLAAIECSDKLEKVKDLLNRASFFDTVTMDSDFFIPADPTSESNYAETHEYVKNDNLKVDDDSCISISSYEEPRSLEQNYAEVLEYVQNDNSANIIGIWGMGGVGKSTLLSKIHNSCLELSPIWVDASSGITFLKVQREILQKRGLFQASKSFNILENRNILLFIDNLREAIDLRYIELWKPSAVKLKVVFTTRSKVVCDEMKAEKTIKVDGLNWEQSWLLFKEKVGERVILSDPRISKLAEDVAKECKGIPLALIVIGRAMSTKKSFHEWKYSLYLMRKSQFHAVPGVEEEKMRQILKTSYDSLASEKLQKCFLSISMWPGNMRISKVKLIECWMGLDIIDNFESITEAYLIGFSLIGGLQAACLLEDIDGEECVKMHHVLRDLALWIASECGKNKNKWIANAGFQSEEAPSIDVEWNEAECISLMEIKIEDQLLLHIPSCPNLLTLVLQRNHLGRKSQLICFRNFHPLRYLDLCENELMFFPNSIYALIELQYLNLSFNKIEIIPEKIKDLEKLKYLILRENHIGNVPKGVFSDLSKLLVLDMFSSFGHSSTNVEAVECLEKTLLYLGINVSSEEELNKLMLLPNLCIQALCIRHLHDRSFHFMSMIPNLYCLKELNIQDGNLMEIVFDNNGVHQESSSLNLETLTLEYLCKLNRIIWKDITPEKLFVKLREIKLFECILEDITWVIHLPSLRTLDIKRCQRMRIAVNDTENETNTCEGDPTVLTFPSLKKLTLNNLRKLEKISNRSIAFPQLETVQVSCCPLLKTLPFDPITTPKIHLIEGERYWWNKLVWEDDNSRSHFNKKTIFTEEYTNEKKRNRFRFIE